MVEVELEDLVRCLAVGSVGLTSHAAMRHFARHTQPADLLPTEPPTANVVNLAPRGPLGRPTDRNVTVQGGGLPRSRAPSLAKPFPKTYAGGWRDADAVGRRTLGEGRNGFARSIMDDGFKTELGATGLAC